MTNFSPFRFSFQGLLSFIALILFTFVLLPALLHGNFSLDNESKKQMGRETIAALKTFQSYHFSGKQQQSLEGKELVTAFMQELDYNRLFFIKADEEEMAFRFGQTFQAVYLNQGDAYPAFEIFKRYHNRVNERLEWVNRHLKGNFDFSVDESYQPDRSELDWSQSEITLDAIWQKRLKHELLQEILREVPLSQARKKVQRRYDRMAKQLEKTDAFEVHALLLNAIGGMYDPHTTFLSKDMFKDFDIAIKNSLEGIGAILRDEEGYCVIQELIPGGPAEASGRIHPGDKIVEVAQSDKDDPVDVIDMKLKNIVKMIRGQKGTPVYLTILPVHASDVSERKKVVLIRDQIQLTQNLAKAQIFELPTRDGAPLKIGRIQLPSFYGRGVGKDAHASTSEDVEELLEKLKAQGVDGVVLDLRRNGGGLLSEAIQVTGLFIKQGPVVQIKDTVGNVRKDWDRDESIAYEGPLIVLVSRRSASASEIVAGALQSHGRALIVGDANTHGKGTVQQIFPLSNNRILNTFGTRNTSAAAKVTIQKFYLPNGDSTQKEGVKPDIVLPSANVFLPIGESDLPGALAWDQIQPIFTRRDKLFTQRTHRLQPNLLLHLKRASEQRQADFEEFVYLQSNINWIKQKQEEKFISLNLKRRLEQKQLDNDFRETMRDRHELLRRDRYTQKAVLLDISQAQRDEHQLLLRNARLPNGKPKANQYYGNTFYYQLKPEGEIKEVRIESFDFDRLLKHTDFLADFLAQKTKVPLQPQPLISLFKDLKNGQLSKDFQMDTALKKQYGRKLTRAQIDDILPAFLTELIRLNPEVVEETSSLDIPLRESLRILADWIAV